MNTTRHSENVTSFEILPSEEIKMASAVSLDSLGRAHMLRAGERFAGFAVEQRDPLSHRERLSICVAFEGVEPLTVEGFTAGDVGKTVFANGEMSFTIDAKSKKASPIGHAVGHAGYGRALVKFCSQKL